MSAQQAAMVQVRDSTTGSWIVWCQQCGQVSGSFVAEGHAYRQACTHYVSEHMAHAVWREAEHQG